MYIPQWHNGEDACTLSNLETPFSTLCKSFVFHLMLKNVSMLCLRKKRGLKLFCLFFYSHVKGRVLVALADGTISIFHRDTGILFPA